MQYRRLGRTGLQVSEIAFGAWGIGGAQWLGAEDGKSLLALGRAVDAGLNLIDTALAYGDGHSERLIGRFLKETRAKVSVATKVPPRNRIWPARPGVPVSEVFPRDYIIECTETSLKNLGVQRLDLQQLHVWSPDWKGQEEWWEAIELLKQQGKILHFGISVNDHQPESVLEVAQTGRVETFQVIYNIFDQSPERELFPLCEQLEIGIIARVPFDEGSLTGQIRTDTKFPKGDFREHYFRDDRKHQVQKRIEPLEELARRSGLSLPELALRFCLHHPAVSTVIPGMRRPEHVQSNCAVSDGKPLSAEILAELRRQAWQRNFYE